MSKSVGTQISFFKKPQISITLDIDTFDELNAICKAFNLKRSALINDMLTENLKFFREILNSSDADRRMTINGILKTVSDKIQDTKEVIDLMEDEEFWNAQK